MRKSPIRHQVQTYHKRNGKIVHNYLRGHGQHLRNVANPTIHIKPKGYTITFNYSAKEKEIEDYADAQSRFDNNKITEEEYQKLTKGVDAETVKVIATSYENALKKAFNLKHDSREATEILVVDPKFGEMFHSFGKNAANVARDIGKTSFRLGKEYGTKIAQKTYAYGKERGAHAFEDLQTGLYGSILGEGFIKSITKSKLKRLQQKQLDRRARELINQSLNGTEEQKHFARMKLRSEYPEAYSIMAFEQPQKIEKTIIRKPIISNEKMQELRELNEKRKNKPLIETKNPSITYTVPLEEEKDGTRGAYRVNK